MNDVNRTREQLLDELAQTCGRVAELEALQAEHERAVADAQHRAAQLALISKVGQRVSGQLELDVLLSEIVTSVQDAFDYSGVMLLLLDEETQRLILQSIAGGHVDILPDSLSLAIGEGMIGRAAETGETQISGDINQDPYYVRRAEVRTKSELAVPIKSGQKVIGVLDLQSDELAAFGESDQVVMEALASQVAAALENAQLFYERERRVAEMAVVNEIGQAVSSAIEFDDLLETVYHQVSRLFDTASFFVATYEEGNDEWTIAFRTERGQVLPPGISGKVGIGLSGYIIRNRQHLLFRSTEDIVAFHRGEGVDSVGETACSWMGVPLIAADKIVGVLGIQNYEQENLYREQDLALFSTIAAQVAPALDNMQLLEQSRRRAREMEVINEVGQTITSLLELDVVLRQIVDVTKGRFGYYLASIALVEGERLVFRSGSTIGDSGVRLKIGMASVDLMRSNSLSAETARTDQPVMVGDVLNDPRYLALEALPDTRSELCVPIKIKGRVIGVLDVQSDQLYAYDQNDVNLLQSLANQAGVVIENARLFQDARVHAEELTVLNELSQALTTRLSVEEVMDVTYRGASRLLDTANFTIGLYDSAKGEIAFSFTANESEIDKQITVIPVSQGMNGYVIRNRTPVLIQENVLEWQERAGIESVGEPALSWMGVPLIVGDHVLGSVSVQNFTASHAYNEHDRDLFVAIASQAAIAFQNARLYEAIEQELTERKRAEEALQQAYAEVEKQVEERTAELQREVAERERLQQEVIQAQKQTLQELSTPIIPIMDQIIVMPLIGSIDSMRARDITRALLAGIRQQRAKIVILDITGVSIVDSSVAEHLNKTIQSARLKGARTIITGISDAVAETIVDLGIDWSGVATVSNLQTGLRAALARMGKRIEG
ncbi:MAG: GAF domain-containing protein [Chloroflexi bacterium]|nr:GAF domain-containing protein [Chloroflexota bacterium]